MACYRDSFFLLVWGSVRFFYFAEIKRASPYYLTADTRVRQFSFFLVDGFGVGMAHNGVTHFAVLFLLHFPSFT
jgi:hypothetical protein